MADDPEALAQLARLLRDEQLTAASPQALEQAVDNNFQVLVDGIVAEAAASDDVFDHASGADFAQLRIGTLHSVLTEPQASRLLEAVLGRIASW